MNTEKEILDMVATDAITPDASPLSDWSIENRKSKIENQWFFQNHEAVQLLRDEAARLRGARFIIGQQDCVWVPERLHVAAGSVEAFNFPRSKADYSRHVHNDRILTFLRGQADDPQSATLASRFAELDLPAKIPLGAFRFTYDPPFMPGDLLVMKSESKKDLGVWHMPVMLDDHTFIHCAFPRGVTGGDIFDPNYRAILVALFRARAK